MYPGNSWYGHSYILCRYCNVKDQPIFGSLQHGYYIDNKDYSKRKFSWLFPFFCWSERVFKNSFRIKRNNIVKIIGSPFLYLDKIKKKKINEKGVLFFPSHNYPISEKKFHKLLNSNSSFANFNHEKYIKKIKKIIKGPYTVAIYYSDYSKKISEIYEKNGWQVRITGNRRDKYALIKIYNLINRAKYIVTSGPGSPLLYSLYMKKKTRIIFNKNEYIGSAYSKSNLYFFSLKNKISKKIYKEFVEGRHAIDFAKKELGFEFLKSKNELIKILGLNNLFKKILMFIYSKVINIKYKDYR